MIFAFLIFAFFITFAFIKIRYVSKVLKDIKNGKIIVKEDEVLKFNNNSNYSDVNVARTIRFKKIKGSYLVRMKEFYDTKIGDICYIIYVESEKEPILIYNKNSISLNL